MLATQLGERDGIAAVFQEEMSLLDRHATYVVADFLVKRLGSRQRI